MPATLPSLLPVADPLPATTTVRAHLRLARRGAALLRGLGARRVVLFGSLAKGRVPDFRSDVDLAVEGLPTERFLTALGQLNALGPCAVDLVELETAPLALREEIGRHGVDLHPEPFPARTGSANQVTVPIVKISSAAVANSLRTTIANDLGATHRLNASLGDLRARRDRGEILPEGERIATGYYLHNLYNALENSFVQISRSFENHVVNTGQWHRELLDRMFLDLSPRRPAVLPEETRPLVNDLCAFRHFFCNSYGLSLDEEKLDGLHRRWERGGAEMMAALERFADALPTGD